MDVFLLIVFGLMTFFIGCLAGASYVVLIVTRRGENDG